MLDKNKLKDYEFFGNEVKKLSYKRQQRASKLQKYMKRVGSRLKKYTLGIKDYTHKYTRTIINQAQEENSVVVVGNIHNITKKWDKKEKQRNYQYLGSKRRH